MEITDATERALVAELKSRWDEEVAGWRFKQSAARRKRMPGGSALWDSVPEVDSKAVAAMSPVFERHLGHKLDLRLVRKGGYASFKAMIDEVVPPSVTFARKKHKSKASNAT